MIRIDSIKQLDAKNFEVGFFSNGRAQTNRFEYCAETIGPDGAQLHLINSDDAKFHNFIASNRKFKNQLFVLVRQIGEHEPLDLPVEVEEGWSSKQ